MSLPTTLPSNLPITSSTNNLRVVFVGHVDHGKSTCLGHLLYLLGYISPHEFDIIEKEAKENKMTPWKYSYIVDIQPEERARGKTHAYTEINTSFKDKTIQMIDTPGHQQLIQEMIQGSHLADVGVVVCSIKTGEIESGLSGQIKDHLTILRGIGIKDLIIVLNKMDLAGWDQTIFEKNKFILQQVLERFKFKSVDFCGVSGWTGENLVQEHQGFGPSLIERIIQKEKRSQQMITLKNTKKILIQLVILPEFNSIITCGYKCIMHTGNVWFSVQVIRVLDKVFAKANDKVKIEVEPCTELDEKTFAKNIILRYNDCTVAMGLLLEK